MNTMKIKIFTLLSFFVIFLALAIRPAEASRFETGKSVNTGESTPGDEDILSWLAEPEWEPEGTEQVLILDREAQLIETGSEQDEHIKQLIQMSDLLTEVDKTKYYRLSYR